MDHRAVRAHADAAAAAGAAAGTAAAAAEMRTTLPPPLIVRRAWLSVTPSAPRCSVSHVGCSVSGTSGGKRNAKAKYQPGGARSFTGTAPGWRQGPAINMEQKVARAEQSRAERRWLVGGRAAERKRQGPSAASHPDQRSVISDQPSRRVEGNQLAWLMAAARMDAWPSADKGDGTAVCCSARICGLIASSCVWVCVQLSDLATESAWFLAQDAHTRSALVQCVAQLIRKHM